MSLKIRTETITECVEIKEVFCDYCNVYVGNMDGNGCIHKTSNSSQIGDIRLFISPEWYHIEKHICKKCEQQKYEAISEFCNNIFELTKYGE